MEQIVDFEVNEKNFWVAANGMIARKVNTKVKTYHKDVLVKMKRKTFKKYAQYVPPTLGGDNSYPSQKDIRKAFDICYKVCDRGMVKEVCKFLEKNIGVMLVAKNAQHQDILEKLLIKKGVSPVDIYKLLGDGSIHFTDDTVKSGTTPDYKVVIVPLSKSEGYTLTRLGAMVTCVYPSNQATRQQLEGRINRLSQHRKKIYYKTLHTGILTYVLQKHNNAASLEAVLQNIAKDINL